jgi:hypothetical protein
MSLISFTPLADGVTAVAAAATNTPLSTIYNDYNGNITDANIAANAAISGAKVAFGSLLQTQVNAGTAGGNLYYVNLGGIKMLWGVGAAATCATGGNTYTFIMPGGFFSTVTWGVGTSTAPTAFAEIVATLQGYSTGTMSVNQLSPLGAQTATPGIFAIGT